jgi:adenylate cyclase
MTSDRYTSSPSYLYPTVNQGISPYLLQQTDNGERRLSLTDGNCWTLGRGDDNQFVVKDRCISRNHAMIQYTDAGDRYLIDLGSSNGTFVNGRRVSIPVTIHDGDTITFGQTEFEFHCPSANDDALGMDPEGTLDGTVTSMLHLRKLMSVMVVDMRNFTILTRQTNENLLSEVMSTWFRNAGAIIRNRGSWVDKYIGDALMALWFHNGENVTKQEMMNILLALDDLNQMTRELNKQYPLPFELKIGAGINTGHAMIGNAGSGDRPDYTALGDTVNAAFQLEAITKELNAEIAIGSSTYRYLAPLLGKHRVFKECSVELKGYDVPAIVHATNFGPLNAFLQIANPDSVTQGNQAQTNLIPKG